MSNKDIERLFQEQFKDFEQTPHPKIWKGIDKQLHNKPKSSLYRWIGFVGILALLFGFWELIKSTPNSSTLKESTKTVRNKKKVNTNYKTSNQSSITIEKTNSINTKINELSANNPNNFKLKKTNSKKDNSTQKSPNFYKIKTTKSFKITNSVAKNTIIYKNINNTKTQHSQNTLNQNTLNNNSKNITNLYKESLQKPKATLIVKAKLAQLIPSNNKLYLTDLSNKKIAIHKINNLDLADKKIDKWEIGTSFSPIYYASLSKGSPLDENIASSQQTSSNSYAYGINVAYKLTNKWSLKSGFFKRNLAYKTADVGVVFQVITNNNIGKEGASLHAMNNGQTTSEDVTFIGELKQELKYFEIPLELKYTILQKRIGVNLNGGFSTLFLNGNKVSLERSGVDFSLGEASNINNTSYSLNIGFDTSLRISDKWNYSISPSFKYHLKTFTKNDGGFKPYSIGFNTGIYYNF